MQKITVTTLLSLITFVLVSAFLQFASNMRYLEVSAVVLRDWSSKVERPSVAQIDRIVTETYRRILLYDDMVNKELLYHGMIVNKTESGKILDVCDSLLFSSLRYASLQKVGLQLRAKTAWNGIENSKDEGFWLRHPKCKKGTSRDMILGLMIALSQEPDRYDLYLKDLLKTVDEHNGYLGKGPLYVSYATPQISLGLRQLSDKLAIAREDLPYHVRNGFSTGELAVQVLDRGYASHLIALSIWLEMEVNRTHKKYAYHGSANGSFLTTLTRSFDHLVFKRNRLQWQTHKLASLDPHNMFFRYLRLKSMDAMTPNVAYHMLDELLAMPQFPANQLPSNCERKADYLWQRKSEEYKARTNHCYITYNGTDFLWMASLLLEEVQQSNLSLAH